MGVALHRLQCFEVVLVEALEQALGDHRDPVRTAIGEPLDDRADQDVDDVR